MEYLVALFNKNVDHPFDLAGAATIETDQGQRHAATYFAVLHLPRTPPQSSGSSPGGTTSPCVVTTYEITVRGTHRAVSRVSSRITFAFQRIASIKGHGSCCDAPLSNPATIY
jgi:hypothetical protein